MVKLEVFGKPDFEQLKDWMSDEEVLTNWAGSLFSFPLTTAALCLLYTSPSPRD